MICYIHYRAYYDALASFIDIKIKIFVDSSIA